MADLPGQPNLSQLVEAVVEATGEQIRVAVPGVFASVASDLSTATVQPAIRRNDSAADPAIPDVPILFPRFAKGRLTWPVEAGDPCLLVFCDRSIEEWTDADGEREVEPTDPRTHDITDALAIPLGLGGAASGRAGDVSLRLTPDGTGTTELRVQADGKVALGGIDREGTYENHTPGTTVPWSGTCELVQLLVDVLDALAVKAPIIDLATVPGALLPTAYDLLAEARSKLNTIKGSL